MTRGGPTSARLLRRSDIPRWVRVDTDGAVWTSHANGGFPMTGERRAESQRSDQYLSVYLGVGDIYLAHRVVYAWFHGEAPKGVLVRHLDDNGRNNRPSNLALGDNSANMLDAKLAGAFAKKMTPQIVREIREAYQRGARQSVLADRYCIGRPTVHKIVHRQTWVHV